MADPTRPSMPELVRVAVSLIDPEGLVLKCQRCGHTWTPTRLAGGGLQVDYWKCPRGCNWDPCAD